MLTTAVGVAANSDTDAAVDQASTVSAADLHDPRV